MPVNTTSTGATYGKSSDPLCPLGFHPQVRWPTRCKRCFRDYKEHSDESDKAKFSHVTREASVDNDDPWASRRANAFQRSRSVDVNMLQATTSRYSSGDSSSSSSYASRTTTTSSLTKSSDDDMPQWKKNMLARQKQEEAAKSASTAASTSSYTSRYSSSSTSGSTAGSAGSSSSTSWGASKEPDTPSYRSRSVQPESSSYDPYSSSSSYKRDDKPASTTRVKFAEVEATTKPSSSYNNYGSSSSSATTTTASSSSTSSWSSSSYSSQTTKASTSSTSSSSWGSSSSYSSTPTTTTASTTSTSSWSGYGSSSSTAGGTTSSTSTSGSASSMSTTASKKADEEDKTPSWKKSTPSWKKPVEEKPAPKAKDEVAPKATPSWKKAKEEPAAKKESSLGKISETGSSDPGPKTWKKKTSVTVQTEPAPTATTTSKTTTPANTKAPSTSTTSSSWSSSKSKETTSSTTTSNAPSTAAAPVTSAADKAKMNTMEREIDELKTKVGTLQREKSSLQKERDDLMTKKPISFESAKAAETTAELRKASEKISEQELTLSKLEKERKGLQVKVKDLESLLEKRPQASETNKTLLELQTKLKFYEKKANDLERENNKLHNNVQNLEGELEEVQDNFREDEADEYRNLKRDLETQSKNVRVLQFKLKKTEKSLAEIQAEKADMESKMRGGAGGGSTLGSFDTNTRIRGLEKELEQKTLLNTKYEQQIADLRAGGAGSAGSRKQGPVLSRTGSVERGVEEQLLKDLQDSIERENDLKEQLNMAEDESNEMRKKVSRIEDENESLAQQLKKMAKGSRRSPSPAYAGRRNVIDKDEGISEDGEELSAAELKVQLEVSEGETGLLRKKVDNLLTENLKLTKEIKDVNTKLSEEKKKKPSSTPTSSYGSRGSTDKNSQYEQRIDELQTELNGTRVKLIEKEREVERLDAQVKASSKSGSGKGKLSRSSSQEEKVQVIEQEANVLREKVAKLEAENEKITAENKTLSSSKYGKKPASTQEKLQMDKFALEEKVKNLEAQVKDQTRKMNDLQDAANKSKTSSGEVDRLKREKSNLESEVSRLKVSVDSDKRKADRLERELSQATEKADKAQRELITAEREKRRVEDDKNRIESSVSKLESDNRVLTRERDRLKDESEAANRKNRENLQQTQEGLKTFKDQMETLKTDLQEERSKHRETRKTTDEKVRSMQMEVREAKNKYDEKANLVGELEAKLADIDDKWSKSKRINKQKTEKVEKLEQELSDLKTTGSSSSAELSSLKSKLKDAEREVHEKKSKITQLEKELKDAASASPKKTWGAAGNNSGLQAENDKLKKEIEDLKKSKPGSGGGSSWEVKQLKDEIKKHELSEEELVTAKAKLTTMNENLEYELRDLRREYNTIKGELTTLRQTYNSKADDWIKEKLDLQQRMKDLQDSLISSAGEGWESERDRFKQIIDDRDNQITQLKIEGDVARSQVNSAKKEADDLKLKLMDYEKMSKFQRAVSTDSSANNDLETKLTEARKQLSNIEREHKAEVNNMKMKYDGKIAVMGEEIAGLKSQTSKYRRERENYKEMLETAQKSRSGRTSGGDEVSEMKSRMSDLQYQIHALEDELAEAKLDAGKTNAQAGAQKSAYEIQIAELNSKINEMEEESLIESGRARIAGTRTKMELAWQKERESQKKLINELNTMARDLKSTLLEVEKERDRERLESKRKFTAMKSAFEEEQDDTKKQITDLQYDLLELRDAHAKLRTTNEKLRRDKEKFERERDEFRYMAKERSRAEAGEDKKVGRLLKDMDDFMETVPKILGESALKATGELNVGARVDAGVKTTFKQLLIKLQDSKSELEAIHKMNEEEREKMSARRAMMKRTGSTEPDDSPRGRTPGGGSTTSRQSAGRFRKSVSIGETIAEGDALWKSTDSRGSNESLASNASIPLPIPVRTRSTAGAGSESGYSSDYNALSIRRLERDTSVDRLSTGSRESGMSTQSEWVAGEKKKKAGLIGKLKKLTKGKDEKEFGSGSDISSVSVASSSVSAFAKVAKKRSMSIERGKSKERDQRPKNPEEANQPFDQYFSAAASSGVGTISGGATGSSSSASGAQGSTIPRTYRRY